MEWLVGSWVLVSAAVAFFALLKALGDRRARGTLVDQWRSVGRILGLRDIESVDAFFGGSMLTGIAGRRRVTLERSPAHAPGTFAELTVEGDSGITLRPEDGTGDSTAQEREIELGDEVFDAEVEVHGTPDRVRAILDAETRRIVRLMLRGHLEVPGRRPLSVGGTVSLVDGHLRAVLREGPEPPAPSELREVVDALLALADRFDRPSDVAARLAAALEREPQWRVRLSGLEVLSTSYPTDAATVAALRHALVDEVAEVRLQAARGLGDEGREVLLKTACSEAEDDIIAAHAIDALGARMPPDLAASVLRQALRSRRPRTVDSCVQVLGLNGGAAAAPLLARVLALESGALAVAAAKALGKVASPEGEAALLASLKRGEPDVVVAAIEALGHTAGVRVVMSIQEVAEEPDSNVDVRRVARQAVAEIQSRLPGASSGQVSIAEDEAGQLSIADDDPRGRVSLPGGS
jgi:HEAT repeat protein